MNESGRPLRVAMIGNGATVHALVRGAAIAALGHRVRLVTLGPVLPHSGLEVRTRPIPRNPIAGVRAFASFMRDLREFEPDILHVHYAGGRLGSLALASGLRPLVVTVMGGDVQPEQYMGRATYFDHRATKRLLAEADVILACSESLRKDIGNYGAWGSKTETVRWGIETERFARNPARGAALRAALAIPRGPVVLSPRILQPLYNIHLIVEAMPAVLARNPDATLLVSRYREDPAYAERLRLRAEQLGIARSIHFMDRVDNAMMPDLMSMTNVVVSVPFSDGMPVTLFESLASETPIVVGRLSAYEELVRDGEEVLMADLDAPSIAGAVSRLLEDETLAGRLRAQGLARVRGAASLPDEARRVESYYRRALAAPRGTSALLPRVLDAVSLGFKRG